MKCNAVNNKECPSLIVSQLSVHWLKYGQPCLHQFHMLCTVFLSAYSLCLAFGFTPIPPPTVYFPLINQCDRFLVPLVWGLIVRRCRFTNHWGVTLSMGWLCQKWKPVVIPGTHLH